MNRIISLFLFLFLFSCASESNRTAGVAGNTGVSLCNDYKRLLEPAEVETEEVLADTAVYFTIDTLYITSDEFLILKGNRVYFEDSLVVENANNGYCLINQHSDTVYLKTEYQHDAFYGWTFLFSDSTTKKIGLMLESARPYTDDITRYYAVLSYDLELLLFENVGAFCGIGAEYKYGYTMTCNGVYYQDQDLQLLSNSLVYLHLLGKNTVFWLTDEEKDNGCFINLKTKEIFKTITFKGYYEALTTVVDIRATHPPLPERLVLLDKNMTFRVFDPSGKEKKYRHKDLPVKVLDEDNPMALSFYPLEQSRAIVEIDSNGVLCGRAELKK